MYFNWLDNIQDWCISRQLWWGHRIPAYYCEECGEMTVSAEEVTTCPKCGEVVKPHRVCKACGTYKGKEVISKDMVISNNELSVEVYDEKKMRTDILVEIEKNIINLEMNRTYYEGLFEKNSAYHQKLMVEQYKSGEEYDIKKKQLLDL